MAKLVNLGAGIDPGRVEGVEKRGSGLSDRRTQQCLMETIERSHTNLLQSIPFSVHNAFVKWLFIIE